MAATFKIEQQKDFTIMANHHLRNKKLSLKAKGLQSLMLSLPPAWDYTLKGLATICSDGVDSISSALKELENAGYVVRKRVRNEQGRLCGTEYIIYQIPQKALRTKTDLNGKILCWLKQTKRNLNRKHQNQYNKKSYRKKKVKSNLHGKNLYR